MAGSPKVDFMVRRAVKELPGTQAEALGILKDRRALLKWGLIGGGMFLLGKFFGPLLPFFSADRIIAEKELMNFKILETRKEMKVYNPSGEEIVIFEKD